MPYFTNGHGGSWLQIFTGIGGQSAVEIFFVISGFYMALILNGAYKGNTKKYLVNRFLRIFPMYWIVLAIYLLFLEPKVALNQINWFSNIFVVGSDFFSSLVLNRRVESLVISPAWTLAIEIPFYAFAPLLCKINTRSLAIVAFLILAVKVCFFGLIWELSDPWTYRVFPMEWAYFLVGILIFRSSARLKAFTVRNWLLLAVCASIHIFAAVLRYWALTTNEFIQGYLMPAIFIGSAAVFIPQLIGSERNSRLDSWLGNLSYPVYLIHMLLLTLFVKFANYIPFEKEGLTALIFFNLAVLLIAAVLSQADRLLVPLRDRNRRSELAVTYEKSI